MKYISTRGNDGSKPNGISFSDAILSPSAGYGGLYVPDNFDFYNFSRLRKLSKLSYEELAFEVLKSFGIDINEEVVKSILQLYRKFDDPNNPAPVVKLNKNTFVQELWHGQSRAFKDMALQPFPSLLSYLAMLTGKYYLVVTTTSGDTGPAALDGFKDLPNVKLIVYYPIGATSKLQAEQMQKALGKNVKVIGVSQTDFDNLQARQKEMLKSDEINQSIIEIGYELSAANSVNIGRIVFQIVYYFWSYLELFRNGEILLGEKINYIIPSGNSGNSLGCFYAKIMGLPVNKIILASNENNVITDFVKTGIYDIRDRFVLKTNSPAMDIKISSNTERKLNYLFGDVRTLELMNSLEDQKHFELTREELKLLQEHFSADYATDKEVLSTINSIFYDYNYLIDPHTAVAFVVRDKLEISEKSVIISTAEWTKFAETIAESFVCEPDLYSISTALNVKIPDRIKQLETLPVVHDTIINIDDMYSELLNFIGEWI